MALSVKAQLLWWGIAIVVAITSLLFLSEALTPFLTGLALAYLLDPIVDRLENWGLSRKLATTIVAISLLLGVILVCLLVIPLMAEQLLALLSVIPQNIQTIGTYLETEFSQFFGDDKSLEATIQKGLSFIESFATTIISGIFDSVNFALSTASFLIIVPVVMIYLLIDFDNLTKGIGELFPRDHESQMKELLREMDQVLASFIRGQLIICLILGTFYGVALTIVGLQAGLIVGLVAGLLSFIPFFGAIFGGILSVGLSLFQFWGEIQLIVIVAAIFLLGQLLESNFLTPRIVGKSIGLHPVWILFSLSAFGLLLGFTGILLAVPIAAVLGVFIRFGVKQYKQGRLYLGESNRK